MKYKVTVGGLIFDILNSLLMIFIFIVMVYPFMYVLNYSLSSPGKIVNPLLLLPKGFTLESYKLMLKNDLLLHALFISVSRTVIGPVTMLFITGMTGFVYAKKDLVFGRFIRIFIFCTTFFGAGIIPTYLLMKNLGFIGTFSVYIIPGTFSVFNMILIKTYIQSLPDSLVEAVYIDGGNDFQAYWKVIFHVCLPVNAAIILFDAIGQWNSFMDTQMYNASASQFHTLQYVLYNTMNATLNQSLEEILMKESQGIETAKPNAQSLKMAITVITILPVMCFYPILQKYFASGIMIGSIKA